MPVRALAWLGRQGTRAIAVLLFLGILVPPIGDALKPFVAEAVFILLCISFMRTDVWSRVTTCDGGASLSRQQNGQHSRSLPSSVSVASR